MFRNASCQTEMRNRRLEASLSQLFHSVPLNLVICHHFYWVVPPSKNIEHASFDLNPVFRQSPVCFNCFPISSPLILVYFALMPLHHGWFSFLQVLSISEALYFTLWIITLWMYPEPFDIFTCKTKNLSLFHRVNMW